MQYDDPIKQEMWDWFCERFTASAQCVPYESEKSGYQYVCGGPYFPGEILPGEFGGKYDKKLIDEVVADLEAEESEWAKAGHY